jgi:hypothetical protein
MYRQESNTIPPENYSGNAFAPNGARRFPAGESPAEPITPAAEPMQAPEEGFTQDISKKQDALPTVAAPAETGEKSRSVGGLAARIPFLSSLLPPRRESHGKGSALPDWALLGAIALLFLTDTDSDILPFLLLLLLWD